MAEGVLSAINAKVINELASKTYIPLTIAALFSVVTPDVLSVLGIDNSLWAYFLICLVGIGGSVAAMFIVVVVSGLGRVIYRDINYFILIGTVLFPVGLMLVVPELFNWFVVPHSPVAGAAVLAWSFMLLGNNDENNRGSEHRANQYSSKQLRNQPVRRDKSVATVKGTSRE